MPDEKKNTAKSINFNEKLVEMVDQIMQKKGYTTFTMVVHQAIIEMHGRVFKDYVMQRQDTSIEAVHERKKKLKELKEQEKEQKLLDIAEALGGEILEFPDGKYCKYYTYTGKARYPVEVPITALSADMIKTQYSPSKEKVMKLQEQGKVDYEVWITQIR